jgi:hypothetical protein
VDDVDDGDDIAAPTPFAVQRIGHRDEADRQDDPEDAQERRQQAVAIEESTALETGEASLAPMALSAMARQTYTTPLVRPPMSAAGLATDVTASFTGHVAPLSLEHS